MSTMGNMERRWSRLLSAVIVAGALAFSGSSVLSAEPDEKAQLKADREYDQGVRATRMRRPKQAIRHFEKALSMRNQSSDIFYNLVQVADAAKDWKRVATYATGFLHIEDGTNDAREIIAKRRNALRKLERSGIKPVTYVFDFGKEGWEVFVDDVPLSTNKVTEVPLLPGSHAVSVRQYDHHPWTQTLEVEPGATPQNLTGALEKMVYKGKLEIATTPAEGVAVFVDDKLVGKTPMKPLELATLRYLVRFEKDGYDSWVRYVTIEKDKTQTLKPALEKSPPTADKRLAPTLED
ncbi:MAG: hypothetical protein ACI9MR_003589 [Myxococcota bacterium]|jgi:hypothetical protein